MTKEEYFSPKKELAISKIQSSIIRNNVEELKAIKNFEYMENHFDKKNIQINKIIHNINIKESDVDRTDTAMRTIQKLQQLSPSPPSKPFITPKSKRE